MPSHHPPHIYVDQTWYMITASTLKHAPFLSSEAAKVLVRDKLLELVQIYEISLRAWVILNNHYHLLLKTNVGRDLSRCIGRLHGNTSKQLNLQEGVVGRQIWHNYWDSCIRTERDLWTRFNYIHQNPVNHGYVRNMKHWPFSSYHYYLKEKGFEWLQDCWQRYPVVDHLEEHGPDAYSGLT